MTRFFIPLLAFALLLPAAAFSQTKLTYQLPDGEQSESVTKIKTDQTLSIAGMDVVTSARQSLTVTSKNGQRGADGKLVVEQHISDFKTTIDVAGQELSYDSANPDAPPPGTALDVLLDVFKAMSNSKWKVTYGQDNRVISVEGRDDALKDLPAAIRDATAKQFDPEYLAESANDDLNKVPSKPVQKGDIWKHESTVRLDGGQTLTFNTAYRYEGTVEKDGKTLHKIIEKTTDVKYDMDASSPSPLKYVSSDLKIAESSGETLFDNEAGHVVSTSSKIHITGPMKFEAGGMELPASNFIEPVKFEAGGMELPATLDLKLEQSTTRS